MVTTTKKATTIMMDSTIVMVNAVPRMNVVPTATMDITTTIIRLEIQEDGVGQWTIRIPKTVALGCDDPTPGNQ